MPMPMPSGDDDEKSFLGRCMGDAHMNEKFPEQDQRAAVCYRNWREHDQAGASRIYAALKGVELFRTGKWNGDQYSARDLDDMVISFDKQGFRVPVKLGHKESSGDRAYGWVENLRRSGDKLVGDLIDIPDKVYDVIKEKGYDAVSSEIFWNLKRNDQTHRRALKAVALLGAEVPAVSDLAPLSACLPRDVAEMTAKTYTLKKEGEMPDQNVVTPEQFAALQKQVTDLTSSLSQANTQIKQHAEEVEKGKEAVKRLSDAETEVKNLRERTAAAEERERRAGIERKVADLRVPALRGVVASLYDLATQTEAEKVVEFTVKDAEGKNHVAKLKPIEVVDELVKQVNKGTAKLFQQLGRINEDDKPSRDGTGVAAIENPGAEVDRLTKEYQAKNKVKDYREAMTAVLADPENAELKVAYNEQR